MFVGLEFEAEEFFEVIPTDAENADTAFTFLIRCLGPVYRDFFNFKPRAVSAEKQFGVKKPLIVFYLRQNLFYHFVVHALKPAGQVREG
jgi:hypothetical protein